jgi:hypothetical protein
MCFDVKKSIKIISTCTFLEDFSATNVNVHWKNKPIPEEGLFRSVSELVGNFKAATKNYFHGNKQL